MIKKIFSILALCLISGASVGQMRDFPDHPIKLVIPVGTGSGADITARFFAAQLSEVLGQSVIPDNRPGANGLIGITSVKTAPADGYTLLLAAGSTLSINPIVLKGPLPYDPVKDLKPLTGLTKGVYVIVVPPNSKFQTLADLVTDAKKEPGKLNVGVLSTTFQLALGWFESLAGVKFTNVPYKAGTQVITDLIGNQLDFAMVDRALAATQTKAGKLRALAVTGDGRHPDFPGVPTVIESGYRGYEFYSWLTIAVRNDTPDAISNKLVDALQKVLASDKAKDYARLSGADLMPLGPVAIRKFQLDELANFRKVAEVAGIKPE